MKLTDLFMAELEAEAFAARRVLERVPRGRNDWKPHPKSMTLGYLAALVARLPAWTAMMIHSDEYDLNSPDGSDYVPRPLATADELLQTLGESMVEALEALAGTTDEHLMKPWRMLIDGRVVSEQPRFMSISYGVFSHLAHHRGQLTVYLRLNDVPVPAIYGVSADERRIEPSLASVARAAVVNPVWSARIMDRADVFLRF